MKILELFSGYGTASFALKRLGIEYECVGYSDIDKYANQCFRQNHSGKELGDVRKINPNELEDVDLITSGFPCQSFSTAGKQLGELDTRGTLFYEIIRIAEVKQPKYMLLENVKGLTNKKFKDTFDKILGELDRIGYNVKWKVLNSKNFGIPQNRERVWFVCFRQDLEFNFEFPQEVELKLFLKDILEDEVDEKYYLNEKQIENILSKSHNFRSRNIQKEEICSTLQQAMGTGENNIPLIKTEIKSEFLNNGVYGKDGISPCLNVKECKDVKILNPYNGKTSETESGTIGTSVGTATGKTAQLLCSDTSIRKLTPKECFRLMGFLNDEIDLSNLSDTQRYKLAGNGQVVTMVELIFKEMFKNETLANNQQQ
jgi:DNA (cytosine-5)-methyltransferase 1